MATLASLKTQISTELGRGRPQDSRIANAIRHVGLFLERNNNFQYMHRFVSFTITEGERALSLPVRPKKFNFLRIIKDDGEFHYLSRIDPKNMDEVLTKIAGGWWLDALDYIWLDNTPDQDYSAELDYVQFTAWASLDDSAEPWPLLYGEDYMFYEVLLRLGATTRQNQATFMKYKSLRDDALKSLLDADYALAEGGQKYEVMEYLPPNYGTNQYPGA